jgi:hypothetical protein
LRAAPDLTVEKLRKCLWNYAQSDNIVPSARAKKFLPKLFDYMSGPLNNFGQPKNGVSRPVEPWGGKGEVKPDIIARLRAQGGPVDRSKEL